MRTLPEIEKDAYSLADDATALRNRLESVVEALRGPTPPATTPGEPDSEPTAGTLEGVHVGQSRARRRLGEAAELCGELESLLTPEGGKDAAPRLRDASVPQIRGASW